LGPSQLPLLSQQKEQKVFEREEKGGKGLGRKGIDFKCRRRKCGEKSRTVQKGEDHS